MKVLGVIPARFASSRFPGKPLVMLQGKTMVQRVYEQSMQSAVLSKVVVATDDARIADAVSAFGGNVIMTSPDHLSGTDRCAEALVKMEGVFDAVINIQGDEPFIDPKQIDLVGEALRQKGVQIATLVKVVQNQEELTNVNSPKVVLSANGDALYFSRQPIPFMKGYAVQDWLNHHTYYKHIGIYGYKAEVLPLLTKLPQGKLEQCESLEQLRWLEHGYRIRASITDVETIAIDTPDDLAKAERFLQQ